MIDFPPSVTTIEHNGTPSCSQFCAYHSTLTYGGKSVPYGVFPALVGECTQKCGTESDPIANATSLHSHELAEAITDVEVGLVKDFERPLAWADPTPNRNEIGDRCQFQNEMLGGFVVQKNWSNALGACVATRQLSTCIGSRRPCTPCSPADEGGACSGATPYCATDPHDPLRGACVACTSSAVCPDATPVCDRSGTAQSGTCRGCAMNAECGSDQPVCDVARGRCVGCTSNADCDAKSTCDLKKKKCVAGRHVASAEADDGGEVSPPTLTPALQCGTRGGGGDGVLPLLAVAGAVGCVARRRRSRR
jgi:hypothetical protein